MKANRPKPKRQKKKLDIDSLLSIVEKKLNEKKTPNKRYLTVTYIGYYDDKSNFTNNFSCVFMFYAYFSRIMYNTVLSWFNFTVKNESEPVKIETSLMKINHKKRKDACPFTMVK